MTSRSRRAPTAVEHRLSRPNTPAGDEYTSRSSSSCRVRLHARPGATTHVNPASTGSASSGRTPDRITSRRPPHRRRASWTTISSWSAISRSARFTRCRRTQLPNAMSPVAVTTIATTGRDDTGIHPPAASANVRSRAHAQRSSVDRNRERLTIRAAARSSSHSPHSEATRAGADSIPFNTRAMLTFAARARNPLGQSTEPLVRRRPFG